MTLDVLDQITPLLITYNEAPNIERTLSHLTWAKRIVVIDSFSTDATCDVVRRFAQAVIIRNKFGSFASQCNLGLQQIETPWVLSLDADYMLSGEFVEEVKGLPPDGEFDGYSARFRYCIFGKPLRASLYPPRVVLYRKDRARYRNEGHGHRVQMDGGIRTLNSVIYHDDRKPFERWFEAQLGYAAAEARHLLDTAPDELTLPDRVRRGIVMAPWLVFFYTLFGKGLILDGWPGWFYVFQRTLAEVLLSLKLIEAKLERRVSKT